MLACYTGFDCISEVAYDREKAELSFENQMQRWNQSEFLMTDTGTVLSHLRGISTNISSNAEWKQDGVTVAGGNGNGTELHQLSEPHGLYVDEDATVYVADCANHRIMKWTSDATSGQVVAGGHGEGSQSDQLNNPTDVIVDTDSLIICDYDNRRVVRWPRRGGTNAEILISNIDCSRMTMDDQRFLYISHHKKHVVRQWQVKENRWTDVAGDNKQGIHLDQLNWPTYIFVDRDHSVYVSDTNNDRVMKWIEGAKVGIVVAGGRGKGNDLTRLNGPRGVVVDQLGTVYVVDEENHRIMRWLKGATNGSVLVGGNGEGKQANQLHYPNGLSFDRHGNLYVADCFNHRVQKFELLSS
ncbi:unnamed protein product [Rotaria magnacalcarata]|uniref:Uncharacterized protein n=2 Tax=Rotaria magnacalcarata TaxID=392030 RepID=A0A817AKY6_9BILA|nr:unnamed protein product [Rotaria magnacalcarata]